MLWALHPDRVPDTTVAEDALQASFRVAHGGDPDGYAGIAKRDRPVGLCRLCEKRVEVPDHWDDDRKEALAKVLRSRHYQRLAARAVARRRVTG